MSEGFPRTHPETSITTGFGWHAVAPRTGAWIETTMEAHLQGTANRLLEQGHDLVKVSTHSGACELCQPWQGEVLSLTGKTPGYPTIQEARAAGLFHPNCLHAYGLHIDLDKEIEELEELEKAKKTRRTGSNCPENRTETDRTLANN